MCFGRTGLFLGRGGEGRNNCERIHGAHSVETLLGVKTFVFSAIGGRWRLSITGGLLRIALDWCEIKMQTDHVAGSENLEWRVARRPLVVVKAGSDLIHIS